MVLVYLRIRLRRLVGSVCFLDRCINSLFILPSGWVRLSIPPSQLLLRLTDYSAERLLQEGGPPLPRVDGSVFYFLFVLIALTLMAGVFYAASNSPRLTNWGGIVLILGSLIEFETVNVLGGSIAYWRLDNFLIYVPLAYFWSIPGMRPSHRVVALVWLGFFLFSAHDFILRKNGNDLGAYSRISIVTGTCALWLTIAALHRWRVRSSIDFLARHSLGIFAVHKYWLFALLATIAATFPNLSGWLILPGGVFIDAPMIFIALATFVLTLASVFGLAQTPLRQFVE